MGCFAKLIMGCVTLKLTVVPRVVQDARFKNAVLAKLFTHSAGVEVLDLAEAGYPISPQC